MQFQKLNLSIVSMQMVKIGQKCFMDVDAHTKANQTPTKSTKVINLCPRPLGHQSSLRVS